MFKYLILSLKITVFFYSQAHAQQNYFKYHQQVNEINTSISEERYEAALKTYYELFSAYSFIFLRDYKVASQLAMKVGHKDQVFKMIRKGIASGWGWKSLKSHPVFKP